MIIMIIIISYRTHNHHNTNHKIYFRRLAAEVALPAPEALETKQKRTNENNTCILYINKLIIPSICIIH